MRDEPFWALTDRVWAVAPQVRSLLRARRPVDLAALVEPVFELGRSLANVSAAEQIHLLGAWRAKAHALWATGRASTPELAYLVVALGADAYEEALRGEWEGAVDVSEGAFAAMLASFDAEAPPRSPLARDSRPVAGADPVVDTPTPRAVRRPPREDG